MKKEVLGHQVCPECGLEGAEIKRDKSGHPYRWCPDCTAQYFTRGEPRKAANLLAKIIPLKTAELPEKEANGADAQKIGAPGTPTGVSTGGQARVVAPALAGGRAGTATSGRKAFSLEDL